MTLEGLNWSREPRSIDRDEEYEELLDFYYFCFVTKLSPSHVDQMSFKERQAATEAFQKMQKDMTKGS